MYDISTPEAREKILSQIQPEAAHLYHELLLDILKLEMDYRQLAGVLEYYENLYWCSLLLFLIGDPADTELMWKAKNINMDTGAGFDIRLLVGAGVRETIAFLEASNCLEIAEQLKAREHSGEFKELKDWTEQQIAYFY